MSYRFQDLKAAHAAEWQAYVQHEFVRQLGAGTLDMACFRHYLKQDYLFLLHFSRAHALAIYKSRNMADLRHALEGLDTIVHTELQLHIDYCREWGISEDDLAHLPEARANMAYTRYVLDAGNSGDLLDMHVALAPCLVGYGEVADFLNGAPATVRDGNPYDKWIAMYESDAFQQAVRAEVEWLDRHLAGVGRERFAELAGIFRDATRLEIGFWQMGLDLSE